MTTVLTIAAGRPGADIALVAPAVLVGQLSVGWSNDAFDAPRDAAAGRLDKPIVAGVISRSTVALASALALVACAFTSLALGVLAGALNLMMVGAAWAYNAGLKSTAMSALAYAAGFGLLPAFAAVAGHRVPRLWEVSAGALLGVGAHFANVLPDLDRDLATGVRGVPQRLAESRGGPPLVRSTAFAFLVAASAVIAFAPQEPLDPATKVGFGVVVVLGLIGAVAPGRLPFAAAIGVAAIDVALFVLRDSTLA